jgi:hypothetical protein
MKRPNNFRLEEFVSKDIFKRRGEKAWELFTPDIIETINDLRVLFNTPITINNWFWDGRLQYRGLRPTSYYAGKESLSQHIRGNALDFDVKDYTAEEARQEITAWKRQGLLKKLTGLELDTNWVHIDCRQSERLNQDGLFLFKP